MDSLTRLPGVALHHQISTLLEDMIASGRLRDGDQLPTEELLRAEYGVSRVTVRRALQSLEARGLLKRQRGRGTYVSAPFSSKPLPMPMKGFLETMAERRARSKPSVKEFGFVPAPREVAAALQLREGATVLRVVRLRSTGRTPILHSIVYLSEKAGRGFTRGDFGRQALTELLLGAGIRYARIEMLTRATLADASLAKLLQVGVGSALVDVMRIGYGSDGRPFEFQILRGPSDRFHTHVTIKA
jgi:GntR family transcriptional regulator